MSNVRLNFARTLEKFLPTDEVEGKVFSTQWYRDEKRPLQFVFHTDEIIIDGRIEISSPFKNYTVYKVGYVPTTMPIREEHDDYVVSDKAGLFPDPLVVAKGSYLHFAPNINHSFYLTVEDDALVGEYEIKVSIFNKETEVASATARVLVDDTPLEGVDITLFNWLHYDSIAEIHRLEPFSKEFYGVLSSYLKLLKKMGSKVLFVPVITPPLDTYVGGYRRDVQLADVFYDGEYSFSFERLGEFLDFAEKNGFSSFEFPPFFSQWDAKYAAPFIVKTKNGKERRFGWESNATSDEYVGFLSKFLQALADYLKDRGIYDRCYFHVCDEARDEDHYVVCRDVVKRRLVGAKFIDTRTKITGEKGSIDVLSISTAIDFLEKGIKPSAVYYCWADYKNYVTNRFLCMPLSRIAVLLPQMYLNDADVFLHWGFNFYQDYLSHHYINPFMNTDLGGIFPGGDGFIVYPDVVNECALPSVRLYAFSFGLTVYRLLKTLESLTDKNYVKSVLTEFGMSGYTQYPRNDSWLYDLEDRLLEEIRSRRLTK